MFLLGFFSSSTILLLIFIIKFYKFNILKTEKVYNENIKNDDSNLSTDIDKSSFFK